MVTQVVRRPPAHRFARALIAVAPVAAAAFLGNLATLPNIPTWYAGLAKPGFTPPNGVFGPVWTVLYALMAYAVWRILSLPAGAPGRGAALAAFFVQLALNAAWSWAFFWLRSPAAGLLVILPLLATIVATIRLFWPLDRLAAALLAPYAAWVAFATALNAAIWRLNP
jgi:benzodiazapine receptor